VSTLDEELRALIAEVVRVVVREELPPLVAGRSIESQADRYVTVSEAARIAAVSVNTLRSWFSKGLRERRQGRVVRIRLSDLEQFMDACGDERCDPESHAEEILARRRRK
jgi:excisionase family DNA binding protein